jgi:hypothetical protein
MAWYNPISWYKKEEAPKYTPAPTPAKSETVPYYATIEDVNKGSGTIYTKPEGGTTYTPVATIPASGGGGGGYKTTDPATGYNPATKVNELDNTPTSRKLTAEEVGANTKLLKQGVGESPAAFNARLRSLGKATQAGYNERLNKGQISQTDYNSLFYAPAPVNNNPNSNNLNPSTPNVNISNLNTYSGVTDYPGPYKGSSIWSATKDSASNLWFNVKGIGLGRITWPETKSVTEPFKYVGSPSYYSNVAPDIAGSELGFTKINTGVRGGTVQGQAFNLNTGDVWNLKEAQIKAPYELKTNVDTGIIASNYQAQINAGGDTTAINKNYNAEIKSYYESPEIKSLQASTIQQLNTQSSRYNKSLKTQGFTVVPIVESAGIIGASFVAPQLTAGAFSFSGLTKLSPNNKQGDYGAGAFYLATGTAGGVYSQYSNQMAQLQKQAIPKVEFIGSLKGNKLSLDSTARVDALNYREFSRQYINVKDNTALGGGLRISQTGNNVKISGILSGSGSSKAINPGLVRNFNYKGSNLKVVKNLGDDINIVYGKTASKTFASGTFQSSDDFFNLNLNKIKYSPEPVSKGNIAGIWTEKGNAFSFSGTTLKQGNVFSTFRNVRGKLTVADLFNADETGRLILIQKGKPSLGMSAVQKNLPALPKSIQTQIKDINSVPISGINKAVQSSNIAQSAYYGLGQYERSRSSYLQFNNQRPALSLNTLTNTETLTKTKQTDLLGNIPLNFGKVQTRLDNTKSFQIPLTNTQPAFKEAQKPRQIQIPKLINTNPNTPLPGMGSPNINTPIIPVPVWFPTLGIETGMPTRRRFKGKQPKKYTPSFSALIFNIKGRMPKGIETGARVRPITKGFSFYGRKGFGFKMPSFNFGLNSTKRKRRKK